MDISPLFVLNFKVKFWISLRKIGIHLFILTVIGTTLDQWITQRMEDLLMSSEGVGAGIWLYGAISLVISLTYPLAGTLLVLSVIKNESLPQFFKKHFQQNLIEEMRAWGIAMLWSLALVIPGLIRFLRYLFVPFVVTLDPAYERGEKDALKESLKLSRGRLLPLIGLFIGFSIFAPGLLTVADEWKMIWKTPVQALMICFVEMLLNLCLIHLLFHLYQRGVSHDESAVSMERN